VLFEKRQGDTPGLFGGFGIKAGPVVAIETVLGLGKFNGGK